MQLSKDMAKYGEAQASKSLSSAPFLQHLSSSRSYYESNDLPSALGVVEDALARHPDLVSDDFINMAAELYITNKKYSRALEVAETLSRLQKRPV